ncbi:MAG: ribosome maturation factor RimM [Actinomycetota bacterium]|nr:ribosome maturation factor RimM [Actinomycetota bacterium]
MTRLEVGRVSKAHGLRGEVLVIPVTNQPERFDAGARLWLDGREVTIVTSRASRDAFVVRFEGVADRDGAEAIRGLVLTAEPLGAAPEGEVWIHEVIGSEVRDRNGTVLGRVVSVEANPAHDLLVLDSGVLIPMVFVVEQMPGAVVVDLPEGLLDL